MPLLLCPALAQQAPVPPEISKYHDLLRKRPQAGTIFERFQDAWLANGTRDTLREFLKTKAAAPGATAADHQLLALFFARQGEDAAVVTELDAALKLNATNADAWLDKARAQTRLLEFDRALTSLEAAAKSAKDENLRVEIARLQGRALLRLGRNDDALKLWQELAAGRPDDLDLAEEVVELMADEGLYAEAAKQAEALVAKTKPGTDLMTRRLRLGDLLLRADKRDEALKVFESVLEQSGQDSWVEGDVLSRIAQPFRREDDIEGLKKRLEALHTANPLRPAITMELAEVRADLGEKDEAVKLVTALLERTPGRRDLQERFVAMLERMERFEDATAQMKRLTEQHADDKELLVRLATLQEKLKDTKSAQATLDVYLKKAVGKDAVAPEHDYLRVARLYESWEMKEPANATYTALAAAHPDSVSAKEALAHFHHRNEAHDKALEIWKALMKSGGIEDVLRVGQALQSHGQQQEALDLLRTRETEFAKQPRFLAQLSQLATSLKDHPQAMEWARQRLALITDHAAVPEAVRMAQITIEDAEAVKTVIDELQKQAEGLSIPNRCLLAVLLEQASRAEEADQVLQRPTAAPADQLMLGAQRAKLLETRQEWARAAGVIEELMKLPGGQTSDHARRLVSLHRRALASDKALAVIPEWKKLSPGAVLPWLEESAIHLEQGKETASLDVLRQASRKFADDRQVLTTLAEALARSGRTDEARRAYVSLYEQTEDIQTRLRLLAPLAEMSRAEGQLDSLVEEFQTRQRQNRGSAAPWMALAEIHRSVNNDEERRRCLYEASRLRPKDLALLTEIARCEEESGLTKEALRTLEAAATLDKTPDTKQRIARLMIESGDDEAGYRLLFELAGGKDADARMLEKMADTMCEHSDWARAIRFLQPLLPQFPDDYRLRYLYATALEEEGRDQEASAAFTELLGFHVEMPEVSAVQSQQMIQAHGQMPGSFSFGENYQLPDGAAEWMTIPSVAQAAYEHRNKQSNLGMGWGGLSLGRGMLILNGQSASATPALPHGWVAQPPNVTMLSAMALYHLIEIGQAMTEANKQALAARISAAGVRDAALILEVPIYQGAFGVPVELLNQHADHAALHAVWLVSRAWQRGPEEDSISVLRRCMTLFKDSKPLLAWQAGVRAMMLGTPEGLEIGREAITLAEDFPEVDSSTLNALTNLLALATSDPSYMASYHVTLPADVLDRLFALGQRWNERAFDAILRKHGYWSGQQVLSALAAAKRWPQLAAEIERENKRTLEFEKQAKGGRLPVRVTLSSYSSVNATRLQPQPLQPAWTGLDVSASIANTLISLRKAGNGGHIDYDGADMSDPADEDDVRTGLEQTLAQLKTPTLQMLMHLRLGHREEVEKAVKAMLEAKDVNAGHWELAAWIAQLHHDLPLMVERLQKAAQLDTSANFDNAILHAAQRGDAEQRLAMRDALKAAFARQNRPNMQSYELQQLVGLMRTTGFEKEAEELQARELAKNSKRASASAQAAINPYSRNFTRNSSNGTLSPLVEKLLAQGQTETAHAEILRTLRPLIRQWLDPMQWSNMRYNMRNMVEQLERKTAATGFAKWLTARTAAGWREMTEDAAILENLSATDAALKRYEDAIQQHPRAWQAQMRAATLLAGKDPAAGARVLTGLPTAEMTRFVQRLAQESSQSDEQFTFENRLALIRLMTAWLEAQTSEKRRLDPALSNLLMNLPQYFQREEYREPTRFPALYSMAESGQKPTEAGLKAQQQLREAHDAYCTAMTRHPMLAEGGFAPLAGMALRDEAPLEKLEQQARDILGAKGWVQRAAPSTLYWNGYSNSRYGAQNQISLPHPEDLLVLAAARRGQFDKIDSEVIPLIERAKGKSAARQARAYAELFRAGSDTFTAAAETWLKSMYPQADPGAGGEIVRIWSERKLTAPIHDFFLERIKSQQGRVNPEEISRYVLTLENGGNIKEATAFVRRLRDLWLGATAEKRQIIFDAFRKERQAQRSSRGYYFSGNGNRVQVMYQYNNLHQTLLQSRNGSLAGLPVLIEDGMLDGQVFGQDIGYLLMSDALVKGPTDKLLTALTTLHMLDDAPAFRPWFGDSQEMRTVMGRLINELQSSDSKEAAQRLKQALQTRPKRTFGSELILALMEEGDQARAEAVAKFIGSHSEDLARLTPPACEELHALFREEVEPYPGYLAEAEKKAITPLLEAEMATLTKLGDKILAALTWDAVGMEEYRARENLPRALSVIARKDRAKAAKILEAAVPLLKGTQGHIQNSASGSSPLFEVLGQMGLAPQLMEETISIADREKITTRWNRDYQYSLTGDERLRDPGHVLAIFTGTPFVAAAEQFRCLPLAGSYEASALNRIAEQLRGGGYKKAHDALEKELKERQPQTFGVKTTLLLMAGSNFQGDAYLRENHTEFAKLRPEEADGLLRTLEKRSSKYKTPEKLPQDIREALQPLITAREKIENALAERILSATNLQSVNVSSNETQTLAIMLRRFAATDGELAGRLFEKLTLLFMGESRRQTGNSLEHTPIAYWLRECAGVAPFFSRAMKRAETEGLSSVQEWIDSVAGEISQNRQLEDPAFVTTLLKGSVMLEDERLFNALPLSSHNDGSLVSMVLRHIRGRKDVVAAVTTMLKAEKPVFGVQLWLALLNDEPGKALREFATRHSDPIAALSHTPLLSLAAVLEEQLPPLPFQARELTALAPVLKVAQKRVFDLADAYMAARDSNALYRLSSSSSNHPQDACLIATYDARRGLEVAGHILKIQDDLDAQNPRDQPEHTNAARFLQYLKTEPALWPLMSAEAVKRKLDSNTNWRGSAFCSTALNNHEKDEAFVIALFERSGLFGPAEGYDPLPGLGGRDDSSALQGLVRTFWRDSSRKPLPGILRKHIDTQKSRSFGMELVRCLVDENGDKAVGEFVAKHADDLVKLRKEVVPLIAEALAMRTDEFVDYPPALRDLIKQKSTSFHEMVMAGKPFEEFKLDVRTFETEFREALATFHMRKADFSGGATFFDKALRIMEARQQRQGWENGQSNGWTLRSEMLSKILNNAPANVFCFGMQLFHEEESGLLACSGWHTANGWGPWMRNRWEFWGGRASATEGMNGLVTEIARHLKPQHATLLGIPFHNLLTRLQPGDVSVITSWAENEKAGGARAAILRELAISGRLFLTASAEGRGPDGTCEIGRTPVIDLLMKHHRTAILNDQINPRVRVALAHHLCHVCPFAVPDDLVKKAAQLAARENKEMHCVHGSQLAHIVRRFVQLPVDDAWKRTAQELWDGWTRRQSFAQEKAGRGNYYGTAYEPTFAMVQVAARARNERWLTQLLDKDAAYLKTMRTTVALIATSGWESRAADFLTKEASHLHGWNSGIVKWEPAFAKNAAALAKSCKDPGLALLGELIVAESQNHPMPFVRAFKEPSTFEERIAALAPRIAKTTFKDEALRVFAATFVSNYAPRAAAAHLGSILDDAASRIEIDSFAATEDNAERAETAYILSAAIAKSALAGNAKPWSDAFQTLADITGDNLYQRNYARNRLADALADAISAHWQAGGRREAAFWQKLLMPLIDASGDSRSEHTGHLVSLLMPLLAASGDTMLADWRKTLGRPQLSTIIAGLNVKDEVWRNAGRLAGDEALKTRLPLASRLKLVVHLLADDVIAGRYPTTVFSKIIDEGVLSRREIAENAVALHAALAKKQRLAITLAEHALDAGKAEIAREVIDAALKSKPTPTADHAFDLLELRFGIEVREKRKPQATEALAKLEGHEKAASNTFTLAALKRLLGEMK
ncbi:MAG: tetratricopeptide repeat protein [Prosthecobacter sp.]|nr:tetratricopeptide repeat protein [Prosthecobacter sp.]